MYTNASDSIPFAYQIQRIYEKRLTAYVYLGDVTHGQAFVHLDDAVEAMTRAVDCRQMLPAEVMFLIGEPETCSLSAGANAVAGQYAAYRHKSVWENSAVYNGA